MSNASQLNMHYEIYGDQKAMGFNRTLPANVVVADDQSVEGSWWMSLEPGPGVTVTRHQNTLHLQWFSFDANGWPTWFVAPNCQMATNNRHCAGDLFRNSVPMGGAKVVTPDSQQVGRAGINFGSAYSATLNVDFAGRVRSAAIEREVALD